MYNYLLHVGLITKGKQPSTYNYQYPFTAADVWLTANEFMYYTKPLSLLELCHSDFLRENFLFFAGFFEEPTFLSKIIENTFKCTLSKKERAYCLLCFLHYDKFTKKEDMYRVTALLWAYDQKEKRKDELTDPSTKEFSEAQALKVYKDWKERQTRLKKKNARKQYQKKILKGE